MEKASGIFGYGISPTAYGVFPHFIRTMVKEQKALSLEEAIRKVTSLPARDILGLPERGFLKEGAYADVLLFDLDALRDRDDFLNPTGPPEGIRYVFVNGRVALENGCLTQIKNGQVIRRR
jgi:N-acyl-D-amino-acid deacylase